MILRVSIWACQFRLLAVGTLALVLGAVLLPPEVSAQESPVEDESTHSMKAKPLVEYLEGSRSELPRFLRRRLSLEEQAYLRGHLEAYKEEAGNSSSRRSAARSPRPKEIGRFPEIEHDQSFAINPNPTPRLNLPLFAGIGLRRAGDINGDGTNDYLYNGKLRFGPVLTLPNARDERTTELEDRTGKTSVYFGGQHSEEEDQFFYRSLRPVGDINGDGYADAAEIDVENNQVRLFLGSPSGYQDSGVTRSLDLTFEIDLFVSISGFTDLDGDGLDDVLIGKTIGSPEFEVLYGASEVSGVETRRYEVEGEFFSESAYNTATLGGSGRAVRLFGASGDPKSARIYSFDAGRSLSTDQSFAAEELQDGGNSYELSLVDVNGSRTREIVAASSDTTYAFPDSAGSGGVEYGTTPTGLASGRAIPAGDLDGDGRHDFYRTRSGDNDGSSPFISYGPSDLTGGLTSDTEIPTDPGTELDFRTLPAGSLGDLTGDGRTDLILHIRDDTDDERGRRFLNVSAGREIETSTDIRVPTGYQVDEITQTNELGDINGDGIEDFAVVRSTLDQIEVYYGGESIPETPARTLQVASDTLEPASISTGDVTGNDNLDLVVGYSRGERVDVYEGGGPLGPNPDRSIEASEAGAGALRKPEVVGDIDGDGTEDILASNKGEIGPGDVPERLFLFFGGTPLPSQPDRTIEYSDSSGEHVLASIGDISGGGVPDFAVGRPELNSSGGGAEGQVDIYFGENSGSFGEPDVTLNPETSTQDIGRFGGAIASGDFNGDGTSDIAVRPAEVDPSGPTDAVEVSIHFGGASLSDAPDQRLSLPAATLTPSTPLSERGSVDENDDGLADREIRGAMDAVPVSGEADGLLLASGDGSAVNALLYRPALSSDPTSVLEAPNQDADLGGEAGEIAVGDFTGDGRPGAVLVQEEDNNDASLSSRSYRFELGEFPVSAASADIGSDETVDFGDTGMDLKFDGVSGSGSVTVQKFDSRPSSTDGIGASNVSSFRFTIGAGGGLGFDSTEVQVAVSTLEGVADPTNVTIYKRPETVGGSFDSLKTSVGTAGTPADISDDTLYAWTEGFSEFVLASDTEPLPVELVGFDATLDGSDAVRLTWQTASETNNAGFEVQRKKREAGWAQIGFVESKAQGGTTTETISYEYVAQELPAGTNRFRLRQVDLDGSSTFTDPVSVKVRMQEPVKLGTVAPNPATETATFAFAVKEQSETTIRLYDTLGRRVRTVYQGTPPAGEERRIRVDSGSLPSGTYFLRLETRRRAETRRLTVVK